MPQSTIIISEQVTLQDEIHLERSSNIFISNATTIAKWRQSIIEKSTRAPDENTRIHLRGHPTDPILTKLFTNTKLKDVKAQLYIWGTIEEKLAVPDHVHQVRCDVPNPIQHESFLIVMTRGYSRALIAWDNRPYDTATDLSKPQPINALVIPNPVRVQQLNQFLNEVIHNGTLA